MKTLATLGALAGMVALVVGCSTVEERRLAQAQLEEEKMARQGERVDRICFVNQIDGWRPFDGDTLLVREGIDDWYQLELSGPCDPRDAILSVGLKPFGGSSCLSRGDDVFVPNGSFAGKCLITAIYEWDHELDYTPAESLDEMNGNEAGASEQAG